MTDRLDLPSRYRDQIKVLLREHVPGVEVWAYGSRVNGESHDASDLDLVLRGPDLERIPSGQLADLNEALEESNVPIIVQVHDWARLPESFHREIEQAYVVLVEEKELVMVSEWVQTSLADLIDIKHGFAFKGAFIREEECDDVLLTPGNFAIGGGFKDDKFKYYYGLIPEEFVLSSGDLLVTMTDLSKQADTLGYPAIVPTSSEGCRYLHNQRLGKVLIKDKQSLNARYLYYVLCSAEYRHEVLASATGTTVKHTSPDRIKQFRFLLPPLSEQRAIAHILGTLDDKIELNRRMNETLEDMARALFKSWFVDFDPVRAKMEGRDPSLPKHLADLFPDRLVDSELGPIPEGWEVKALGELIELAYGKALKADNRKGGIIPVYGSNGQVGWHDERLVAGPSIVVGRKGNPGVVTWTQSDFFPIDTTFYVIPIQDSKSLPFLFFALTTQNLPSIAADSAVPGLNRNLAYMNRQIVPDKMVMNEFINYANIIFTRRHGLEEESRTLAAQRDALLLKLVSGELRVGDVGHKEIDQCR
ncbi:MAG: restriction endonuclease subunit S [Candidatus Poribacteria bacterium]|nr:restriction endonuclease subunit S [Candidatus Poribacteria bacterium]